MSTEEAAAGLSTDASNEAAPDLTNLSGIASWIEKREKKNSETPAPETSEPVAAPEQQAAATPPPDDNAEPDWWETGLDTKHGFLKGKKGEEVERAYREAQKKIRESGERANNLERQLRQREAEIAAAQQQRPAAPAAVEPPAKTKDEDPRWSEVRATQFADPERSLALQREILADEARAIATEEYRRLESERESQAASQAMARDAMAASNSAVQQVADKYKVSRSVASAMIKGALPVLKAAVDERDDKGLWLVPDNYVLAVDVDLQRMGYATDVDGDSPAAALNVPPPPTVQADPPGNKESAAPAQKRPAGTTTPLSDEEKRSRQILVKELKLTGRGAEKFLHKG